MFEEKLRAAAEHVIALGYEPVYISLHGSQNYGLAVYRQDYQSDFDFKCIVLPSLWDLVEGKKPASLTIETAEGQIDIKDIRLFTDALERMNPAYLEALATEYHWTIEPKMEAIRVQTDALMRQRGSRFAQACLGLFEEKARRMCHDCPAAHEKIVRFGYDGKQPHHMYRLLLQLRRFEESGIFCLEAPACERALLLQLKLNEIPLDGVRRMIGEWREQMHDVRARIEARYGEPENTACREIVQISREIMYAHCRKP